MRVTFIRQYTGRDGIEHPAAQTAELPDHLAEKLIAYRIVEAASEPAPAPVETAEAAPPRNAARRTTKPKPRTRTK